jgi:hypothetical protein
MRHRRQPSEPRLPAGGSRDEAMVMPAAGNTPSDRQQGIAHEVASKAIDTRRALRRRPGWLRRQA